MAGSALDYAYRYAFPSALDATPAGPRLRLATCGGAEDHPYFFLGRLTRPRRAADLLRGLAEVVRSRFHVPPALLARTLALADPVVTCGGDLLRFEAFSACCSTYARVDFLPDAFEGEVVGRGTTNVDFNAPLRAALARVRDADEVGLAVGADALELSRGAETFVERKVALPHRWLKGFVEVQAHQARMGRRLEVPGTEACRFLRSLPRVAVKHACWVTPAGGRLRLGQTPSRDGVCVGGVQRLRVLEGLAPHARRLRVYADAASQTSAWELVLDEARFFLVLSPEVWRGFSGEGQALADLAGKDWEPALARVRAALRWDARIDAPALARRLKLPETQLAAALSVLGARGLAGYDLAEAAYFHRELPFDLARVESLQPRLRDARQLVAAGGVRVVRQTAAEVEAFVAGSGVEHRVRLTAEGGRCTCPWFAKHQGDRGPCKHVLAVQILQEDQG